MAHIHEKIDFTVAIFIVYDCKDLSSSIIGQARQMAAAWRAHRAGRRPEAGRGAARAKEESGLDVELLGERPPTTSPGTRASSRRVFSTSIASTKTHEHIGLIYWARPGAGSTGRPKYFNDVISLAAAQNITTSRWCSAGESDKLQPPMTDAVKWYCHQAIAEISSRP